MELGWGCQWCSVDGETEVHLFAKCKFASAIWLQVTTSSIGYMINNVGVRESFHIVVEFLLFQTKEDDQKSCWRAYFWPI
jgi:hypothetical protein